MDIPQIIFSPEKMKNLKIGDYEYFSAHDFSLTEKEIEKACKELQETEEKKIKKLQELRNKLAKDKDVNYRTDTPYLLRFLRVRKYDTNKAYQNIRESYMFKKKHPEALEIPENLEKLLNLNIFRYLPYTNENGIVLFHLDLEKWKYQEISPDVGLHILFKNVDIISLNPRMQVNGLIAIWDVKGFCTQHVTSMFSYVGLRGFIFVLQNMHPWRMKKLLVINTGPFTRLFLKMVRPFISNKIAERIILLGTDKKELHQHVNPVLLPKSLGGYLEEHECSVTQNIIDNIPYLKYEYSFT